MIEKGSVPSHPKSNPGVDSTGVGVSSDEMATTSDGAGVNSDEMAPTSDGAGVNSDEMAPTSDGAGVASKEVGATSGGEETSAAAGEGEPVPSSQPHSRLKESSETSTTKDPRKPDY